MNRIESWAKNFSKISANMMYVEHHVHYLMILFISISGVDTSTFTVEDAFVGYQSDTSASIVFKVWQDLKLDGVEFSKNDDQWEEEVNK